VRHESVGWVALRTKPTEGVSYALVHPDVSETEWHEEMELGAAPRPGMRVVEIVHRASAKKRPPPDVLELDYAGALVVRRDVAKRAFAGTGVRLEPIAIHRRDSVVRGWVYVVVDAWTLLDRQSADADYVGSKTPSRGFPAEVRSLAWRDAVAPRASIFRVIECPRLIVATTALAKTLAQTTRMITPEPAPGDTPCFLHRWAKIRAFDSNPRAESAWRAMDRGEKASRRVALEHPLFALAVALSVDHGPRSDTRTSASRHPVTAAAYAVLVDRGVHPITRKGALPEITSAHRYVFGLERSLPDDLAKRMIASGCWNAENVERERQELRALHHAVAGPPEVATRKLPKVRAVDRFADDVTAKQRQDVLASLAIGLARIGVAADAPAPIVIDALHAFVDEVRMGDQTIDAKTKRALGVVFADQLHRTLGWQWSSLSNESLGVVSRDRSYAHVPRALLERVARRGAPSNTIALLFNMLVEGKPPASRPHAETPIA